ncbi:MAG: LytS/YhcK type 5TM receptor domain-containing protein, partial [Methanocorpusculum sp.]|nr:LytS/YhcK type 5TM receptor domain-containing protein [Methanocorpusculum sp.]
LLGGPVVGLITGLVGGIFRLTMGGVTAVPCCIATIAAGLMAGIAVRMWKGKVTWPRVIGLGAAAECFHLLFVFPTYEFLTHQMTVPEVIDVILLTVGPMTVVVVIGLLLFCFFIRKTPLIKEAEKPLSLSRLKEELKSLFRKGGDST